MVETEPLLPRCLHNMKNVFKNIKPFPILGFELDDSNCSIIDLSAKNLQEKSINPLDNKQLVSCIFNGSKIRIGGYLEERSIYERSDSYIGSEPRNIHLGIDIWHTAGTEIFAPIDGSIYSNFNNPGDANYGPTIITEHIIEDQKFYCLYGHLDLKSLNFKIGATIKRGDLIGCIGDETVNGQWPSHLHFQIILDLQGNKHDYPGVCSKSETASYLNNCPDPNLLIKCDVIGLD